MEGAEYAGFGIRLVAVIIDAVVLTVLLVAFAFLLGAVDPYRIIVTVGGFAYFVVLIGLKGRTPGKMAVGIVVVVPDREVPGIGVALMREVVGKLISAVVLLGGYLWVLVDPQKQAWHDKIAGTYVVRR